MRTHIRWTCANLFGMFTLVLLVSTLLPGRAAAYVYAGYKWGGTSPTVYINTTGLNINAWRDSARSAMTDWNNAGVKFAFADSSSSANTTSVYWEQSGPLAVTSIYRQYGWWGNVSKVTMKVNNYYNFNPPYTTGSWYDLKSVLRHELGHWLVLNHTPDSWPIMYYALAPTTVKYLTSDDINGIKYIYGAR